MGDAFLDKHDRIISVSSGALAGSLDAIIIEDIPMDKAYIDGDNLVEKLIINRAKQYDVDVNDLAKAVYILENKNEIWADKLKNKYGGSTKHHLYDFSHHPTPLGLLCSIINEFLGFGLGTDDSGEIKPQKIYNWKFEGVINAIYSGTIKWVLHLISDMVGAASTVRNNGVGTGIPGPLLSMLKELSSMPIIKNIGGKDEDGHYKFAELCDDLFEGKGGVKFDFRTELGIAINSFANRQYIPVLLCEGIVCAFYSIRRFFEEIKEKCINTVEDLKKLDFSKFLPWNSNTLRRMRTISSITFSSIDFSVAAIKAYAECGRNVPSFAMKLASGVNYFGIGRLMVAASGELRIKTDKVYKEYKPLAIAMQKASKLQIDPEVKDSAIKTISTVTTIVQTGTPIGFIAATIGVYKEISESVEEYKTAHEERLKIEEECRNSIEILRDYRDEMEEVVTEYMFDRLSVFGTSLDKMDEALLSDDTDAFIEGNNAIQNKLGGETLFSSQDEFDSLMLSDGDFKL